MKSFDLIFLGGGLANGLIARRLKLLRPDLQILMLESEAQPGGNHTWSFHQGDLTAEQHDWVAPFVAHRWDGYDVQFPDLSRTLPGGYLTVTSERFAEVMYQTLGDNLLTHCPVTRFTEHSVQLADGRSFDAPAVIDGRGYQSGDNLKIGSQAFVGQQWQLKSPHGLTRPILMDATVDQLAGYRFVYTLPLTPDVLLIEDTHYIDGDALDAEAARARIAEYAQAKGWQLDVLQREEQGNLPITLAGDNAAFWRQRGDQPCSGLRAGLFHPTTGYSLPLAVRLADRLARQPSLDSAELSRVIRRFARKAWRQQRFFRMLNRMLFLAGPPDRRWRVMQRFYRLNDGLIARFYAGQPTVIDMARILTGKPPVPVGEAVQAVLKKTPRLRDF